MEVYLTEDIPNTCFQNCGTVRVYLRYEASYSTQVVFFAPKSISIHWILYKFWDGLVHSLESVLQNCAGTQGPAGRGIHPCFFFCMAKLKIEKSGLIYPNVIDPFNSVKFKCVSV